MSACILAALFLFALVALCAPSRRVVARRSWRSYRQKPPGWRHWLKLALTGAE